MAETEQAEEALVKSAGRAAKLALVCLVVALLVLAIDNRIKREIINRGQEALKLLDEARRLAEEARSGTQGPVEDGAVSGVVVNGADGVVHAAGTSAASGANARRGSRKVVDRPPGEN